MMLTDRPPFELRLGLAVSSIIQPLSACKPRRRSQVHDGSRRPSGRYDGRSDKTRLPPGGLGRVPTSKGADTVVAAVEDPWGDGKERVFATVNRRVDVLEMERSHGRISEAAYRTGRTVQATFEKLGRLPGCNWEVAPGDRFTAQRSMVEQAMDRAGTIQKMVAAIQVRIGMIDTRLLRRVLGDRLSFAECAALQGKGGEKGQNYISRRFRDALEDLAEAWTVKGRVQPPPADKHLEAAATTDRR